MQRTLYRAKHQRSTLTRLDASLMPPFMPPENRPDNLHTKALNPLPREDRFFPF